MRRRATQAGVIPFGPIGRLDWAAVTAGLTVPYSSGAVEGHVNRTKLVILRAAGIDPERRRVANH